MYIDGLQNEEKNFPFVDGKSKNNKSKLKLDRIFASRVLVADLA